MRLALGGALAGLVGCLALRGLAGAEGFALALAGAGLNLWAWWAISGMLGRVAPEKPRSQFGPFLVVLTFLVKLPAFVGLYALARGLGTAALGCFIFGVVLVYFAVPTWAAFRAQVS